MKKIGVIDIGTNSMRMLVSQIKNGKALDSYKTLQITRLGEGITRGIIIPQTLENNLYHLGQFKEQAIKDGVEDILVFGTSALRDAKNSEDFIKRAKDELGLFIKVLSGEEEGIFGFIGATHGLSKEATIIDIGGGSTEFIVGNKEGKIPYSLSLDMGALRFAEAYVHNDPITREEVYRIEKRVTSIIKDVPLQFYPNKKKNIIGIGGAITSLAAIKQNLEVYDTNKVHHSIIFRGDLDIFLKKISPLTLKERKRIQGLHQGRANIIIPGTIILKEIMNYFRVEKLTVSDRDNLEGMLYYYLSKKNFKKSL